MKITILYDNETRDPGLVADWGFSCLVEAGDRTLLFDTGAGSGILQHNMNVQGIDPSGIREIFISHGHWDHTNGLSLFSERKDIRLYLPAPLRAEGFKGEVISVEGPLDLGGPFYSTGVLAGIEQSLVVREGACNTLITGCSHPGVRAILERASELTRVTALVGGLHDFSNFEIIKDLDLICATHCTFHADRIRALFPEKAVPGGVGTVIQIPDPGRRQGTGSEDDAVGGL